MTGPFVVTVKRGEDVVSRRAVATPYDLAVEVSTTLRRLEVPNAADIPLSIAHLRVIGSPGRIPLPDGTMIEVERAQEARA